VPGAAIAAVLVAGDVDISAVGTVTYRQGNKVLAFGHPFFNTGPVELPISLAKILTVVPSEFNASKMGASSVLLGALRQDRVTGIYGEIGPVPRLLPMKVRYTDEAGRESDFNFQFTDERSLTTLMPLVLRFVLVNTLQSARLATGENSLALEGEIKLQDGQRIKLDNFYPGMTAFNGFGMINGILQSTGEVAAALGAIMANNFQPVEVAEVDLHFTSLPGRRSAAVEQVWVDRNVVEPGDTISVFTRVKAYRGPEVVVRKELAIPKTVSGYLLSIVVGGSREMTSLDQRTQPGRFAVQSLRQLTELLNSRRRSDMLYFQVRVPDRGVVVDGKELSSLPPTAYAVMQSLNLKGNASLSRERMVLEAQQTVLMPEASSRSGPDLLPFAVSGVKTIRLRVR
jgi:hypothetical protein